MTEILCCKNKKGVERIMKSFFIEAKYKKKIVLPDAVISDIKEKKLAVFTTVQFYDSLHDIVSQLEATKEIALLKPTHSKYAGQILGCGVADFEKESDGRVEAFFYIGDGMFHPQTLLLKNSKPVYCFNPFSNNLTKLTEKDVIQIKKKRKGAYLKFLTSKKIGVLITTKPGQNKKEEALLLEKKFPEKKFYFLLFDTLDFNQLENFPFIECFVNTACTRIAYDDMERFSKPILDIEELKQDS